jgi:hypothetical protein
VHGSKALKARDITAMGKAHGLDDQMKFPGFGRNQVNRENKDSPKRV